MTPEPSKKKRSVVDLSPSELNKFATEAWSRAAQRAIDLGLATIGKDGKMILTIPTEKVIW